MSKIIQSALVEKAPWVGMLSAVYALVWWSTCCAAERTMGLYSAAAVIACILIILSIVDLHVRRLPDALTLPLVVTGIAAASMDGASVLADHAIAAAIGFAALFLVGWSFKRWRGVDGLGLGDAKLLAAAGSWLGIAALPVVLLVASVLALLAVGLARWTGLPIDRGTRVPFGPFLAVAFWFIWVRGVPAWMT